MSWQYDEVTKKDNLMTDLMEINCSRQEWSQSL